MHRSSRNGKKRVDLQKETGTEFTDIRPYPAALTIAGSDSGGGAGIQTDLRTFSAFGVYGCSAITALTAQNPFGVAGIFPVDPEFVALQIRQVISCFEIKAIKTGMLYSAEIIRAVADSLSDWKGPLVIDPVMISTSGHSLLLEDARTVLMETLLPKAAWITSNIPEAEYLSGIKIRCTEDALAAAEYCAERFSSGIVLKGGHADGAEAQDIVLSAPGAEICFLSEKRLDLPEHATHGTGCTFSAALAASLASGDPADCAVRKAKRFVYESLESIVNPGYNVSAMFPKGLKK
ncbi:MAG: bifunctional hydroxymethylpyrimidine kinase/phosphomethylpyrimidine kinase [Lentisphaeria bacterium]|nr:bifunctional hydroxymethylpyrimidine kinase/phosphomethylpyrimidine kinase [Lentisphaeria bacterium]